MIDLHLINMTLAGLGIGAGAITLIAVAVIAIAALSQHATALRHGTSVIAMTSGRQSRPADASLARRAA
jgi:hypothetical protein